MSNEDLPQETEETLNEKARISVLTIVNSENYLPDMETTTLTSSIASIAPSFDTSPIIYRLRHVNLGHA